MASFQRSGKALANGGATETSVMASIEDLLREHQRSIEQQRVEAHRREEETERARAEALHRARADAEARAHAEAEAARQRLFEEQRRAAELVAMREATVQRAQMEAEAQARLAELAARQNHERSLSALAGDESKKKWKLATVLVAAVLVLAIGGGGTALKLQHDKQIAAETELTDLRGKIAQAEQEKAQIKAQLASTQDPQRIAALTKELDDKNQVIGTLTNQLGNKAGTSLKSEVPVSGTSPQKSTTIPTATTTPTAKVPATVCKCMEGDPTCSCIKI